MSDEDNPLTVRVLFDPETTSEGVMPPSFVIAKSVFLNHVQDSIKEYLRQEDEDVEIEVVSVSDLEEEEEIEGESPPRTKH